MAEDILQRGRGITLHRAGGGPTSPEAAENFDLPNYELFGQCMLTFNYVEYVVLSNGECVCMATIILLLCVG